MATKQNPQPALDFEARFAQMEAALAAANARAAAAEAALADHKAQTAGTVGVAILPPDRLWNGVSAVVQCGTVEGDRWELARNDEGYWGITANKRIIRTKAGKSFPTKGIEGRLRDVGRCLLWLASNPATATEILAAAEREEARLTPAAK